MANDAVTSYHPMTIRERVLCWLGIHGRWEDVAQTMVYDCSVYSVMVPGQLPDYRMVTQRCSVCGGLRRVKA